MRTLSGMRFGRWAVINYFGKRKGENYWNCICDCGKKLVISAKSIERGKSKSCGCLRRELALVNAKHGHSHDATYNAWSNMKARCSNKKFNEFHRYGGRGISVCAKWLSFENFLADMGVKPANTSLDRINNDGNYEPSNCKWSTRLEQGNNTCKNRFYEFDGYRKTLPQWGRTIGIEPRTLWARINVYKWTIKEALTYGGTFKCR